jgi:Fic family protein|tara:strand:+ start:10839 stop:11957 length:1119 start_codon:yes stop_codon:yes gene_type:complete
MKFSEYKSGKTRSIDGVDCFVPNLLGDLNTFDDSSINLLQSKASWHLGKLNALSNYLPATKLFYSMLMFEEAKKSNEIEGTKSELNGIPVKSSTNQPEDLLVMNYMDAYDYGVDYLKENDFTIELISELHSKLFHGVNDPLLNAGKYKNRQNWIGGTSKLDARFIPSPPEEVTILMQDLVDFINEDNSDFSDLVKIGIVHYQFETIHPFNDGNGRLGRLIIGLYLIKKGIIEHPLFISNFLAKNRSVYYFNLDSVRYKNDMEHWIKFFLTAIKEASQETLSIIENVMKFKDEMEDKIRGEFKGSSENPIKVLRMLFEHPLITANSCKKELNFSSATANSILTKLESINVIKEITKQKRNRIYVFEDYLKIFN